MKKGDGGEGEEVVLMTHLGSKNSRNRRLKLSNRTPRFRPENPNLFLLVSAQCSDKYRIRFESVAHKFASVEHLETFYWLTEPIESPGQYSSCYMQKALIRDC